MVCFSLPFDAIFLLYSFHFSSLDKKPECNEKEFLFIASGFLTKRTFSSPITNFVRSFNLDKVYRRTIPFA